MSQLYADIGWITRPLNISINSSHSNAVALATVQCIDTSLDIGDELSIDLGYTDDHDTVFTGFIKDIERKVPEDLYTITAHDTLVQAVDYFIVSTDPESPYNFGKGISAEDLVDQVLDLAGLSLYDYDASSFSFGVHNDVEVNLISVYDYVKMISDIITWSVWSDEDSNIFFCNRKPYIMTGDSGQIGDGVDERIDNPILDIPIDTITRANIIDFVYKRTEKDIRNKVVVYGEGGIYAEEYNAQTWDPLDEAYKQILPTDFYKTALVSYEFIGTQTIADKIAEYNLKLFNRVKDQIMTTVVGKHIYKARSIIKINEPITGNHNWYIFSAEHSWSRDGGFVVNLDLRR